MQVYIICFLYIYIYQVGKGRKNMEIYSCKCTCECAYISFIYFYRDSSMYQVGRVRGVKTWKWKYLKPSYCYYCRQCQR